VQNESTVSEYQPTRIEEPFEAWRSTLPDGRTARATVVPQAGVVMVLWFMNDRFEGIETYADWPTAVKRAGELRGLLVTSARPAD
jgi:hypothetical protein